MSNYGLKSKVGELEDQLRHVEAINRELQNEIRFIQNSVAKASNDLNQFNVYIQNNLDRSNGTIRSSNTNIIAAYELQGEIEKIYIKFKNIELANKKIRACNNKKYYEFANYRAVRKIVQGLMDNLDVTMVNDQTIFKAIEVQHLQIPDYWLTCVLISIMAWKNDDKELAQRAMERAIKLDRKSSSIFYMIFNISMEREEVGLKWFNTYQQCDLKGSDERTFLMLFSLISKTINDKVNDDTNAEISLFINKVIMNNATAEGYSEENIIAVIRSYFDRMQPSDTLKYTLLKKHCKEYSALANIMLCAKNNSNILEFILKIVNVEAAQKNEFLKEYMDELIISPNQFEKEVYDEIKYNEVIIEFEGDIEAAKNKYDACIQHSAEEFNLIAEMIDWIYERESQEVNPQIKLSMFVLTKSLQEKAVISHTQSYRMREKNNLPVQINDYLANVDFNNVSGEQQKISDYYTTQKNVALSAIKNLQAYIGFGAAAIIFGVAFFISYWLFAVAAAAIVYGIFVLLTNKASCEKIELKCDNNIRNTTNILEKLSSEYKAFIEEFQEYDDLYDRMIDELGNL